MLKLGPDTSPVKRPAAAEIETAVIDQLRAILHAPELIVKIWMAARQDNRASSEAEIRDTLVQLDPLWDELFPVEQARIVQLLIERVDVAESGIAIRLRTEGLASLAGELGKFNTRKEAA